MDLGREATAMASVPSWVPSSAPVDPTACQIPSGVNREATVMRSWASPGSRYLTMTRRMLASDSRASRRRVRSGLVLGEALVGSFSVRRAGGPHLDVMRNEWLATGLVDLVVPSVTKVCPSGATIPRARMRTSRVRRASPVREGNVGPVGELAVIRGPFSDSSGKLTRVESYLIGMHDHPIGAEGQHNRLALARSRSLDESAIASAHDTMGSLNDTTSSNGSSSATSQESSGHAMAWPTSPRP
jgi:hypothetical protein